jgi:hypothetical protein
MTCAIGEVVVREPGWCPSVYLRLRAGAILKVSGQACPQCQPGQVSPAPATGLVPDPVQMRADRANADVQLRGDLRVGAAPGDQADQLLFSGAELSQLMRRMGLGGRPARGAGQVQGVRLATTGELRPGHTLSAASPKRQQ